MNHKGVVGLPIILGVLVVLGLAFTFNNRANLKVDTQIPQNRQIEESTKSAQEIKETSAVIISKQTDCVLENDLCFEKDELVVNIQEGYLEDADNWISDKLYLVGDGSGGYQLKLEGFPKEFSVRSPVQDFKGKSQPIYIRLQKNVTKKGSYKGRISVKSLITQKTITASLTINYTDGNEKLIHAVPKEVLLDCKVTFTGEVENKHMKCGEGDYQEVHKVRFYYFGNHKGVEVKSEPEKGAKRSLILRRELNSATTFDMEDSVTLYAALVGFPDNKDLGSEVSGVYKGEFIFIDQPTQKEILRVPYILKVTGEK